MEPWVVFSANPPSYRNRTSFFALLNGGTAGLIWGYLVVWVGYLMVFASMAEMASMSVYRSTMKMPPSDTS